MSKNNKNQNLTRKEALGKMGKYAALTAVGTFLILNPQKSQAQSILPPTTNDNNPLNDLD